MAKTQQFKPEEVIQALHKTRGMVYLAADALGCSAETVYRYMRRYASVRQAKEDATERMLDWGEVKLFNRVMAEDVPAIKYLLSTKGKHRGYTDSADKLADALGSIGQGLSRLLDYGDDNASDDDGETI